jgi:simple sugar transport system permease protein
VTLGAIALGLLIPLILIAVTGTSAPKAVQALVAGALGGQSEVAGTVAQSLPLVGIALAWILASSAGMFNVGFDGQMIAGGIAASAVALDVPAPIGIHLALAVIAGVLGGAIWAGIAVGLWWKRNVNEVISTLLLNFVAVQVLSWVVFGPLQAPGQPYPNSAPFPQSARWPVLVVSGGLNWDLLLIVGLTIVVTLALARTTWGLRLRITAANDQSALTAGINTKAVRSSAMLASGAMSGLVGSSLVLGSQLHVLSNGFNATYAFAGIAVALLARNKPLACIPAALLFGVLVQGGSTMEARVGVSSTIIVMVEGLIIILVAVSQRWGRTPAAERVVLDDTRRSGPDTATPRILDDTALVNVDEGP